jgi:predicted PurR-regulated permease PerM
MPPAREAEPTPRNPYIVESPAMVGVFILALIYTLYFASFVLMPLAFAFVLAIILMPIVGFLNRRMYLPLWIGAAVVLAGFLALAAGLFYGIFLAGWFGPGLEGLDRVERRVQEMLEPIRQMRQATERVAEIAASPEDEAPVVRVRDGGMMAAFLDWTQGFVVTAAIIIVLLYFLLASGDLFLRKLIRVLPTFQDKKRAVEITQQVEADISNYLLTITVVNALLGVTTGLAMWALGMPSPILWGVAAALLNYIPYIGSIVGTALVGVVAVVSFDNVGYAIVVALVYWGLTALEGNFIIPVVLGKRLLLNPVVVFVGLVFWGWIWGLPGALLAVPMLSILKIVSDRIEPLNPVGEFLGR